MTTTEQRISAALSNRDITSDALAALVVDTQAALAAAELAAKAARTRALDQLTADAETVLAVQRKAELTCDRLKAALPKLQRRQQQAADAEEYRAWATVFDQLLPRHKAAADKLRTIYQQVEAELIPALAEARAMDAEARRIANLKPHHLWASNNDGRDLPTVEAVARGVPSVNPDYSLMTMRLLAFDKPGQLSWPPHEIPLALQAMGSVGTVGDSRLYGPRWHEVHRERAQQARAQAQRDQDRQQAERDANYHGPRWWERTGS
jgi:hypothetical protein